MYRDAFLAAVTGLGIAGGIASLSAAAYPDEGVKNPRILLTGFAPWEADTPNTSQTALHNLGAQLTERGVDVRILPVSYTAVDDFISRTDPEDYDYIINFGMDPRPDGPTVTIEPSTYNAFMIKDNNGDCPLPLETDDGTTCFTDGTTVPVVNLYSSPDLKDVALKAAFPGLNISSESSIQNYLCAYIFHGISSEIKEQDLRTENIFIHLGGSSPEKGAEHEKFILNYVDQLIAVHPTLSHDKEAGPEIADLPMLEQD